MSHSHDIIDDNGVIIRDGKPVAQIGLSVPFMCPRECDTCQPLAQIITDWHDDPAKRGFTCIGYNDGSCRSHSGDDLRHCFKNSDIDQMQDLDRRDVINTVSVLMQGVSVDENRRVNETS